MIFLKNTNCCDSDVAKQKKLRLIQRVGSIVVCSVIVAVFIYIYIKYGKELYSLLCDAEHMKAFLSRFKGFDKLVFVAIRAMQTVVKIIPAEPLEIGSGALYGTWMGMFLCLLGTEIGSLVIILLTKLFGRRLVNLFIPIEKIDSLKFLKDKKTVYKTLFVIYLIPGTPKDVLTYAAGITDLDMKKFMLITSIARIPSIISSTWCGNQITGRNFDLAIIIFAVTALLSIICSFFYKKIIGEKGKKKNDENEEGTADKTNEEETDS